ncbi:ubiquinone biosynthesis hydroxylase [Methylobrevis pamukkalensis]|uniref:2-octaprenyl-6-methoxyphenol hydroxylase n=1 Tax=Methylobrevis pamukkalensis TaxID=1439726 RepID=A0A1E3GXI0_9HYPH|nr:ubiquinone biosynthesis hydroxylase [Methylobrevis pamukkalensis]ODN68714.1 2-octaprenyl-6-methoxyphenol hydroxylase [Methylobrevis pamukkalensis]
MTATPERHDIVIAGGGYVGLSLALALMQALPGLRLALVDTRPPQTDPAEAAKDLRASAIAAAARRMLASLGVWDEIAPVAQPILDMTVTDSRLDDRVRPVFLTFDARTDDGEPFAHMVPNAAMVGALARALEAAGGEVIAPDAVADFDADAAGTRVRLGSGRVLSASLLVAADGVRSRLRSLAGIRTVSWSYGQSGIVTTLKHELPHEGRAIEHFLPSGPFALLPLTGNRSSLVWSEKTEIAERLIADDFLFEAELMRRVGHGLGAVEVVGPRAAYPLGLTVARDFVRPRFALAGDAAHGIHPIAGQGLNMGFRDVAALAEVLAEAIRRGEDPGAIDVLERYQRWRRFDTVEMAAVTDVLNRLFSNDLAPVRALRDFGLGLVDRLPALKRRFIGEAAGGGGDLPKMLRGQAI